MNAEMVKYIVLDSNIGSMTEFKQIIGRGTRVREDLGKMFFTIFDFRNVTRLFADPDFDGPVEQDDEFAVGPDGETTPIPGDDPTIDPPPEVTPPGEWEEPPRGHRTKYYVKDVEVTVLKQQVQYIGKEGKLITESLTDYTRRNILDQYATLDDFLAAWNSAARKQMILDELAKQGVLMEELQEQIGMEFDPFDLLCHIAFDQPPLTRRERANNVKKRNYFGKYGEQAAAVLTALLEKYADSGIADLESMDVLKVNPIRDFGSPVHIVNRIFGGKQSFEQAVSELEKELYTEAA
jgi:type I restriction enzyme R subunit